MHGTLYHTNEVTVLLGDNWFIKTTAKHALEIAERRRKCELTHTRTHTHTHTHTHTRAHTAPRCV